MGEPSEVAISSTAREAREPNDCGSAVSDRCDEDQETSCLKGQKTVIVMLSR